jgi:hypothetical protein
VAGMAPGQEVLKMMSIVINFKQHERPEGAITLHNVRLIEGAGVGKVRVGMEFSDHSPVYEHVASVIVKPEVE